MNPADDFTSACPLYRNAMRQRARTGSAFEVSSRSPSWIDLLSLAVLSLAGVLVLTVAAVLSGGG